MAIYPVFLSAGQGFRTRISWFREARVLIRQRGEAFENGIKELKIGFGMERMPLQAVRRQRGTFFRSIQARRSLAQAVASSPSPRPTHSIPQR